MGFEFFGTILYQICMIPRNFSGTPNSTGGKCFGWEIFPASLGAKFSMANFVDAHLAGDYASEAGDAAVSPRAACGVRATASPAPLTRSWTRGAQAPTAGLGPGMRSLSPSQAHLVAARRRPVPAWGTPVPGASRAPRPCLGWTPIPGTSALSPSLRLRTQPCYQTYRGCACDAHSLCAFLP